MEFKIISRPSKSPGIMQCPSYALEPDTEYEILPTQAEQVPANLGSCLHDIFNHKITHSIPVDEAVCAPFTEKWGVQWRGWDGVARRVFVLQKKWADNMARFFTNPIREKTLRIKLIDGTDDEGTPDIYQLHGEFAVLLDLKTGMIDLDYTAQIKNYALMILRTYQATGLKTVYTYIWNPIIESYVGKAYTEDDLLAFEKEYIAQIAQAGKQYRMGPFCPYCKTCTHCPIMRRQFLEWEDEKAFDHITLEDFQETRPIMKVLEQIAGRYDAVERVFMQKHGEIPLGNNMVLGYRNEVRKSYDVPIAIDTLMNEFDVPQDQVASALSIKKGDIEDMAKNVAPPRCKGKTVKKVLDRLAERDAVKEKIIQKRTVRRITENKED